MKNTYEFPGELQRVKNEVDNYYKSNPLLKLPFAAAAWSFLAFAEDMMLQQTSRQLTSQELAAIGDNFVNELKDPMYWLHLACKPGGQISFEYNADIHKVSSDLLRLGQKYRWFLVAFTCHLSGSVKLEIQGSVIQPTSDFSKGIEYEAYNELITSQKFQEVSSLINFDTLPRNAIDRTLTVDGDRFRYKLKPKIVSDVRTVMKPRYNALFSLPSEWQFCHYSLGDFQKVFEVICAMAHIHLMARQGAIEKQCRDRGYADSIFVLTYYELLNRVIRYSRLPDTKVRSIFDDLTYGNKGIRHPDPALQPLIKLNSECYAIMPFLWLSISPERNLTVLLNRFPDEQRIYSKLVNEKEALMRKRITTDLCDSDFRFVCGSVANLPDVDLALINDSEKACLLLELKWFIEPAEAREVVHKSKEIEKGISQMLELKQAFADNHKFLLQKLNIDPCYTLEGVVVSENWIGNAEVQSPEVPVIRTDHLIARLKTTDNLQSTMEWLRDRKYLPKEGEHFKIVRPTYTIGKWYLKWYRLKSLSEDAFFPL